jgi:competence protein ComEC
MLLAWLAAAFLAGVVVGAGIDVPAADALASGAASALLSGVLWKHRNWRVALLLAACGLVGIGRFELTRAPFGPHDLAYYNGSYVTLIGTVTAEPDVRDHGINYVVSTDHLLLNSRSVPVHGQVEVHTPSSQAFEEGDQLALTGRVVTPSNSTSVPYRDILAHRGIYSELRFPRVRLIGRSRGGLISLIAQLRQAIVHAISSSLPEPEATLLIAILIGAHSAQLGSLAPILVTTGLIHLIAISGVKIAIVAGIVNGGLRRTLPRLSALLLSLFILAAYWLVSGATVAGLRASIMWLLVFVAAYLGRPTHGLVSLGSAAAVMVAVNPSLLWDTGFQLTTLATATIVAFSPVFERLTRWLPTAIAASITTTTAAQIGVLPVQAASFHVLSPVSILTNAIVLPLIPLTMLVGFATVLYPHGVLVAIVYALVHVVVAVAHSAAKLPALTAHSFPIPLIASYYALLAVVARSIWRLTYEPRRHAHGEYILALGVCAVTLGGLLMTRPTISDRIILVADDAALVQVGGTQILIDGGSTPSVVLAGLGQALSFPHQRLDAVIDTDPRAANVASLLAVVQRYQVGAVLDPGVEYPSHTYARWRWWLDTHHLSPLTLRAGVIIRTKSLIIHVLSPDGEYPNPRDGAGILLIAVHGMHVLYLGPASQREQEDLPFRENVRAGTIISPVPINPTLLAASRASRRLQPRAGRILSLP